MTARLLRAFSYGSERSLGAGSHADVFLAPHFDDIAFSLGSYAARVGCGQLHTVFSRSSFLLDNYEKLPLDQAATATGVGLISTLRRREDLAFATRTGLAATYADIDEAPLRGRDPFHHRHAAEDAGTLGAQIVDGVLALHPGLPVRPRLFAPIGIGGHLDHLVVLQSLLARLPDVVRHYELLFYEDLHYASRPGRRLAGLTRFFGLTQARRPVRVALPVRDPAQKLELITTYRSQFREPPRDLSRFSPNLFRRTPPHEAVWRVEF